MNKREQKQVATPENDVNDQSEKKVCFHLMLLMFRASPVEVDSVVITMILTHLLQGRDCCLQFQFVLLHLLWLSSDKKEYIMNVGQQ